MIPLALISSLRVYDANVDYFIHPINFSFLAEVYQTSPRKTKYSRLKFPWTDRQARKADRLADEWGSHTPLQQLVEPALTGLALGGETGGELEPAVHCWV